MKARPIAIEITGEGNHFDTVMMRLAIDEEPPPRCPVCGVNQMLYGCFCLDEPSPKSAQASRRKEKSQAIPKP